MIIKIGTENPSKVTAVMEAFAEYKEFDDAKFYSIKTDSGVSDQPKTLIETIEGARNRAMNAFNRCDISIGLESGLMNVPYTNTGYFDICIATIYDGKNYYSGAGPGFEYPKKVISDIINTGMNATDSFYKNEYTTKKNIGAEEGIVSVVTKGVIDRKEYHKLSIIMALIQYRNKDMYI